MNDRTGREPATAPTLIVPHLSLVPWANGAPVPHDDEAGLTRLAVDARAGDSRARDLVYQALTPSIDRMVASCARLAWAADCPRRDGRPWDREDLAQEAYLIFNDLVRAWSGEGPFTPYLFAYFPWRLRNAWRRLRPNRPRGASIVRHGPDLVADPSAVAEEAAILLEALADHLPDVERLILLAHIRDGITLAEIALRLGLRTRQVGRRWSGIKRWLRGDLQTPLGGGRYLPFPKHLRDHD